MLARRRKTAQALATRARIVLGCSDGLSNGEVAKQLRVTGATVCKWRERFRVDRLEGILDEPRPGAPRSITDAQVEEVITTTLESMPANSTHWSTRLMAQKTGLSQSAIVRIWRAFGLQPHRVENFKFSKDPQFVEKVRDIVGLYLNPPDRAIVLCVDEKSQVQALNRTQPIVPLAAGVPARQPDVAASVLDFHHAAVARKTLDPLPWVEQVTVDALLLRDHGAICASHLRMRA